MGNGRSILSIGGTVFIALALIAVMGLTGGPALNRIEEGLGAPLLWAGIIALIVLIIAVFLILRN